MKIFSFEVVEHNVESKELKTILKKNKYVAHTPTMRIPMNINNTSYVYSGDEGYVDCC